MKFFVLIFLMGYLVEFASAERYALIASYNTPTNSQGLASREKIINFFKKSGFKLMIVSDRFANLDIPRTSPTAENFLKQFSILSKIKDITELVIITDLHGEARKVNESTHALKLSDKDVSLDKLAPELEIIQKNGAKVAWMDFSCYSGATLALASGNICVASSGSDTSPTQPQFVDQFADSLRAGESFEMTFLRTRKNHLHQQMPRISSSAGLAYLASEKPFIKLLENKIKSKVEFEDLKSEFSSLPLNQSELIQILTDLDTGKDFHSPISFSIFLNHYRWVHLIKNERKIFERFYSQFDELESSSCQSIIY